jgi:hypothetical protein
VLPDGLAVVPHQTGDVHEFGILIEQRRQRVGVAGVPRPCEQSRNILWRSLGGIGQFLTRPPAVEPHELGAVLVQDVGGDGALDPALHQHHDHVSTGTNILDVMRQVLELFEIEGAYQRPLELREESVLGTGRIETLEILLVVQDVDVFTAESGAKQCVDGRPRLAVVGNSPDHAIRRVHIKSPRSLIFVVMAGNHPDRRSADVKEGSAVVSRRTCWGKRPAFARDGASARREIPLGCRRPTP